MDHKLKQQLKDYSNDMYRSLTMMDTSLLVGSIEKYHFHLKALKEKAAQCELLLLKNEAEKNIKP